MKRLNDTLRDKIKEAIREAEQLSSCEFVSVITQKSGDYKIYAFFIAAMFALLIPHVIHFLNEQLSLELVFRLQIVLFIVLMVLTQLSSVTNILVPSSVKRRQAALVATESFRKFGLHRTKKRRAILFFVSLDENYATIITDAGIDEQISLETWQTVIHDFNRSLNMGKVGEGYLEAIVTCSEILKREFPPEKGDIDELPNELIQSNIGS